MKFFFASVALAVAFLAAGAFAPAPEAQSSAFTVQKVKADCETFVIDGEVKCLPMGKVYQW